MNVFEENFECFGGMFCVLGENSHEVKRPFCRKSKLDEKLQNDFRGEGGHKIV